MEEKQDIIEPIEAQQENNESLKSEDEGNEIVIGVRGKAMQAMAAAVLLLVVGIALILLGALGGSSIIRELKPTSDTGEVVFAYVYTSALSLAGVVFIILSIFNIVVATRNNALMDKPVLLYIKDKDEFVCYDRHNKEVRIPNGNIIACSGSAVWSARELKIAYKGKDGAIVKKCVGFARNIDGGALKAKLNEYHKPEVK